MRRRLAPLALWLGCVLTIGSLFGLLMVGLVMAAPRAWLSFPLGRQQPWARASAPRPTAAALVTVLSNAPAAAPTPDFRLGAEAARLYDLWIPRLGLYAPVIAIAPRETWVEGQVVRQLDVPQAFAVGWSSLSAPVGTPGNAVLVGHNNEFGDVFKDLWYLNIGDEIVVLTAQGERRYTTTEVVYLDEQNLPLADRLANAAWIGPTADERLTLVTCWPYYTNTHRLIIVALPVA